MSDATLLYKLLRNIFLLVAFHDSGPSYEPSPIRAARLAEIGAASLAAAMILLVSNVVCVYLIFVEVKLMFGCCFHLSLCHSCSISERIRPFTIHHPPATSTYTCLYFVDTVLFSLKHFSSVVFLLETFPSFICGAMQKKHKNNAQLKT